MAHWLLQHNPARGACGSGDWTVRRYRELITAGDDVALWHSGPGGGVAAVGTIVDAPHDSVIGVHFTREFASRPIPRETLKNDQRFSDALILRMAGGSNPFPLTPAQWQAIVERIPPEHQFVAATVRGAAALAAAGATALREAVRSVAE
ncbi:EVE domain-containing protein [Paractinoplanes lichenicola]|uniref:EVE domain-containing protein n=1 Tax=Paractinoplanes lichenicola TaxID=2802976 RepID=A0ABS1VVE5_9ACTN|nr:EVE domain-containing protein [Actinoplanes lichenicola]MBL7258417.1 EVE domain-containing protein [Actinoplanes lichenicola]